MLSVNMTSCVRFLLKFHEPQYYKRAIRLHELARMSITIVNIEIQILNIWKHSLNVLVYAL